MKEKQEKLENKMKWMLLSTMIPMAVLIIVLLVFFWHYTNKYNQLSNNLAVSSEYNANYRNSNNDMSFKDEVDMDIYYVTIGRRGRDGLPIEQVDKAIDTVEKLKNTSTKKESLRSLKYMTNYLTNLKKRMNQLLEIKDYEERQEFVANNTEILTTLFEKEMQNYIYQEATQLVQLESQLAGNVRLTLLTMCAVILLSVIILLRRSFRLTYSITKPVSEILQNIKKVGKGEYKNISAVPADCVEIQELDAGTRKMAGRIKGLLENVRKEQEAQHLTELQLIQAQVNPHFLYNTLDTIVWLVEGGMDQDAVDMITSLSVFFRTSLSKGKDIIPLSEEERHTLSYLEIQQSRYRDILEFEINIPAELDNIMVPKLTLQPLAENALYHGIKNKRGKGKILIEGFDLGEDMMLRVTDNGQGMTPERLHEVQEAIRTGERAGFGLAAVSERIALYYGPGYGLKISSTEGEGTVMEVYMAKKIMSTNDELCDMNIKIR
jgi:two-component system sensor histidine kinase YesM